MLCFGGKNAPHIVIPAAGDVAAPRTVIPAAGDVAPPHTVIPAAGVIAAPPYCYSEERSDAGISFSIMQRNLARGYVSLRGAERRGNLIKFNARIKLRGNLLLVTHIYEYVK